MEIDSKINNSNYMYIRDDIKKILGDEVKYLTTPNCIIVCNRNVEYSDVVKSLKLCIKELKLIEEHKNNINIKTSDNHFE